MIDCLLRAAAAGALAGLLVRELTQPRTPAGWFADPRREHHLRWWDGTWTGYMSD